MVSPKLPINDKSVLDPELYDSQQALKTEIFRQMNCIKIGQIISFDTAKKTAQVQILFKRVIPDASSDSGFVIRSYPVLADVPVVTLQGGGGYIQFPIAAGDQCLLLFADRNIDAWFQNGGESAPFDSRVHALSDAVAIVGVNSLGSNLPAYSSSKAVMAYDGAAVTLEGGLIKIANNATTLLTLMDGLIDVLAALTVQDGGTTLPLTAAAIASLEAFKLQLATLLE